MSTDWIDRELLAHADRLSGSELHSALLELVRRRAQARSPSEILAQYRRDRFTSPSPIDQRETVAIDGHLLGAAGEFAAMELSPVTPLATSSVMGHSDQNRVLSALRSTEVVSDPTNVFALECAVRMREAAGPFHFTTSQRVVRAQAVPKQPGFAQHFRIWVLASGGIEAKDHAFTVDALALHIRTLHRALDRLEEHGYAFGARRTDILATPARTALADRVAALVPGSVARKPLEHAYYSGGLRYMLWVTTPDAREIPLGDGGTFDWLQRLTSNRRAVYVASGLGAQLVSVLFRR